jgi:hypothetical protein
MLKNALIKLIIRWRRRIIDYNRPIAIRTGTEKRAHRYIQLPLSCMACEVNAGEIPYLKILKKSHEGIFRIFQKNLPAISGTHHNAVVKRQRKITHRLFGIFLR